MRNLIGKIIITYCFFVFIFPFKAYGLDPRWLIFVIYIIINNKLVFNPFLVKCKVIKVLRYPLLMALLSLIGMMVNSITDFTFIYFPIQIIYLLILSFCIFQIINYYYKKIDYYVITKYYLSCLILQSVIAIIMFVNEPIRDFLFDFQGFVLDERVIQMFLGVRLLGLGCFYFGGGVLYGLGLILLIPIILRYRDNQSLLKLILLYLYLFVVGCFFARTCMIGFAISILLLISYIFKSKLRLRTITVVTQFFIWTGLLTISLISIYVSSPKLQEEYGKIIDFGFEAFINLSENGNLSTKSSDGLQEEHLKILPESIKTYLIGDSRWMDGEHYYKGSDVGYTRLLFFFGIGGIILFLLYQYSVFSILCSIYYSYILNKCFKFIFIYVVILLIKGYIDVASLTFIYLYYNKNNENTILS